MFPINLHINNLWVISFPCSASSIIRFTKPFPFYSPLEDSGESSPKLIQPQVVPILSINSSLLWNSTLQWKACLGQLLAGEAEQETCWEKSRGEQQVCGMWRLYAHEPSIPADLSCWGPNLPFILHGTPSLKNTFPSENISSMHILSQKGMIWPQIRSMVQQ